MKTYESLNLEIIRFEAQDVVTASTPENNVNNPVANGCICPPNNQNCAHILIPEPGVTVHCDYNGGIHNCGKP